MAETPARPDGYERIEGLSTEIAALANQDAACNRLMTVPGVEPIISSAMTAAAGAQTSVSSIAASTYR